MKLNLSSAALFGPFVLAPLLAILRRRPGKFPIPNVVRGRMP